MTKARKEFWWQLFKGLLLSGLMTLGLFGVAAIAYSLIFLAEVPQEARDFTPVFAIAPLFYAFSVWRCYINHPDNDYIPQEGEFDARADLVTYIKGDGKLVLATYAVLAVISEVSCLVYPEGAPNLFATALIFFFSLQEVISVPIVRTVVALVVTEATVLLLTVLCHARRHKQG